MQHEPTQIRVCGPDESAIQTYKLSATPSLIPDGQFKGELRSVAFTATSATETMQWFVINCGQFEGAFSELIPRRLAAAAVGALSRGESVKLPGLYREAQFGGGFHHEWRPAWSDLARSLIHLGETQSEATA